MIGKTILHYKVMEKIGEGGMGVVYEAEQSRLDRHVAVKVLPFHALMDPRHIERFRREARASSCWSADALPVLLLSRDRS